MSEKGYIQNFSGEYYRSPGNGTTRDLAKAYLYTRDEFENGAVYPNTGSVMLSAMALGHIFLPVADEGPFAAANKPTALVKLEDYASKQGWTQTQTNHASALYDISHGDCRTCDRLRKHFKRKGLKVINKDGICYVVPKSYVVSVKVSKPKYSYSLSDEFISFEPIPKPSKTMTTLKALRTQKARGVYALANIYSPFASYGLNDRGLYSLKPMIFPHGDQAQIKYPCFARPCPTVPRHGFVESREVHDAGEALGVVAETLRQDPNGEVIFMPRLTGQWSGIITHAGINYGLKNDGATAGKSVRTIPAYSAPSDFREKVGGELSESATIKETPYVEFVEHDGRAVFVQLRDGPEVPRARNYIPEPVTVEHVLFADPSIDLLDWERLIEEASKNFLRGLIVHHPGGSLTSHFAVHAITHKIPVILDDKAPAIGSTLEPSGWEPEELKPADYRAIAERIATRLRYGFGKLSYSDQAAACHHAVATLHASPQWGREKHLLNLRGDGIAAALTFTTAACLGELRHWYNAGPGRRESIEIKNSEGKILRYDRPRPTCELFTDSEVPHYPSDGPKLKREQVYERALRHSSTKLHRWAAQASEDLRNHEDDKRMWSRGYGGNGWADAAKEATKGFEAVERFIRHPGKKRWQAVMSAYNKIINTAHNNGNILNKWIGQSAMDLIAEVPGPAFVNSFTARACLELDTLQKLDYDLNKVPLLAGQDDGQPVDLNWSSGDDHDEDEDEDPFSEAA